MSGAVAQLPAHRAQLNLQVKRRGHVVVLTLDDPGTRYALHGDDLFRAFEEAAREANGDLSIRCEGR